MNLKLVQILLLGCLLLECDFAFSQDTNSITVRGDAIHTTDNIFISNVKHIDTIYCISNPKVRAKDVRRKIFANQACFWFETDSLYKPKQFEETVEQMKASAQYANYSDAEIRALLTNQYAT